MIRVYIEWNCAFECQYIGREKIVFVKLNKFFCRFQPMYSEAKAKERELEKGIHRQFLEESIRNEEVPKIIAENKNETESEDQQKAANSMETNKRDKIAPEDKDKVFASTSNSTIKKSAWQRLNKIEPTISEGQEVTVATDSGQIGSDSQQQSRKKFRTIAKGLSLMSRVRTGDMAMSREQQAFFSKYGINTADEIAQIDEAELGADGGGNVRRRGPFCALFEWNGMSKWEFFKNKLVLDPYKDYYYNWLGIVTAAYSYNLLFIVYRSVFIDGKILGTFWLGMYIALDILTDLIYLLDNYVRSRTGYLDQGLLVKDVRKVVKKYEKGKLCWLDLASCIPVDYLFQIILRTSNPCFRFNRLLRLDRVLKFVNTTEMRVSKPNFFRVLMVFLYILILIHWNACFYYFISTILGIDSDRWVYGKANMQALPEGVEDTLSRRYLYSFYWSTLMLSNVCEVPWPVRSAEFIIVCADLMFGVLIFATIVGNVGSMITNSGAARSQFQARIDNVKNFLKLRSVGKMLVNRISKWFDYLWQNKQAIGQDHEVLEVLPTKLQTEIAMHVHFETLRKVRLFQDCEAGLLGELVLKLELQVFSPMDYVCRKGDVGREMYIVKKGRLQVVTDDGAKVLHTLLEGAVFGELSLLNIPGSKHGNRRSASIRSVGYTDLFVLKKADLWEALREYPEAKTMLVQKGREMLQKDGLLDENAPMEEKSAEKRANEVREHIEKLQEKLARLTAEYLSSETKLQARVDFLESEMEKYGILESDNEEECVEVGPIGDENGHKKDF